MRHHIVYMVLLFGSWSIAPAFGQEAPERHERESKRSTETSRTDTVGEKKGRKRSPKGAKAETVNIRSTVDIIDPTAPVEDIFSIIQKEKSTLRQRAPSPAQGPAQTSRPMPSVGDPNHRPRKGVSPRNAQSAEDTSQHRAPLPGATPEKSDRWRQRDNQLQRRRGKDPRGSRGSAIKKPPKKPTMRPGERPPPERAPR